MKIPSAVSIVQMRGGAFLERADYEMAKIMNNIIDPNTKATAKRTLTLTFTLIPDDDRTNIGIDCVVKSKLASTNPVTTSLFVTGREGTGEVCAVENVPQIPGQTGMDGSEQEAAPMLKLVNGGI